MRYSWDERKALKNLEKHGVPFEEAKLLWTDPYSIEFNDENDSEETFLRIGLNPSRGILLVVFCELHEGQEIRIISASKATKLEKEVYEEGIRS